MPGDADSPCSGSARGLTHRGCADGAALANVLSHVRGSPNDPPPVAIVDPAFTGVVSVPTQKHPSSSVRRGQAHVAAVVNASIANPSLPRSALFRTHDEHGTPLGV